MHYPTAKQPIASFAIRFATPLFALLLANVNIFRYPLIGDDLLAFQMIYANSKGNILAAAIQSWNGGLAGGHFNPLGQLVGGLFHFTARSFSAVTSFDPNVIYAIVNFSLVTLALWLAGSVLRRIASFGLATNATSLTTLQGFTIVSFSYGLLVQLHPWSNDPITSYALAGSGTAALMMLAIDKLLALLDAPKMDFGRAIRASLIVIFALYYYELAVSLIVFATIICIFLSQRADTWNIVKLWVYLVAIPTMAFLLGRFYVYSTNQQSSYPGTQPALGTPGIDALFGSIFSLSPFATWTPITEVTNLPFSFLTLVCTIAWISLLVFSATTARIQIGIRKFNSQQKLSIFAMAATGLTALAIHSFTSKYSSELQGLGRVYLSYSVALILECAILALAFLKIQGFKTQTVRAMTFLLAISIMPVQAFVNTAAWHVSMGAYSKNAVLSNQSVNPKSTIEDNCKSLSNWLSREWPQYYRESLLESIESNYEIDYDKQFCPKITRKLTE